MSGGQADNGIVVVGGKKIEGVIDLRGNPGNGVFLFWIDGDGLLLETAKDAGTLAEKDLAGIAGELVPEEVAGFDKFFNERLDFQRIVRIAVWDDHAETGAFDDREVFRGGLEGGMQTRIGGFPVGVGIALPGPSVVAEEVVE